MLEVSLQLDDGLVAVVKEDCPTCKLIVGVLQELKASGAALTVVTQDDPSFPEGLSPVHDRELEISYRLNVEAVPTLFRIEAGKILDCKIGWNRGDWQQLTGCDSLGSDLPEYQPGCGSLSRGMPATGRRHAAHRRHCRKTERR